MMNYVMTNSRMLSAIPQRTFKPLSFSSNSDNDSIYIIAINSEIKFETAKKFTLTHADGCFTYEDEFLGIYVSGQSLAEVEEELKSEFVFMWNCYGKEADSNLTNGAILIKKWLQQNIRMRG